MPENMENTVKTTLDNVESTSGNVETVGEKSPLPEKSKCPPAMSVHSTTKSVSDGSDKSESSSRSASPKAFQFEQQQNSRKLISKPIVDGKTYTTILYEVIAVLPVPTKISYFQVDTDSPRTRKSRFRIELHLNDNLYAVGTGTSKKAAKQDASQFALEKLIKEDSRVAREIERIRSGAPSLKKLRSRRRRNNKNLKHRHGDYLTDLTYQRERRLVDMEYEMVSMMQNLENLNMFCKAHGQTPYERLMADNPPQSQFNDNHSVDNSEENSIFARHSPQMRPSNPPEGQNIPSMLNPYEDTYEFMQNRAGHHAYGDYNGNNYQRGWYNHHDMDHQTSV